MYLCFICSRPLAGHPIAWSRNREFCSTIIWGCPQDGLGWPGHMTFDTPYFPLLWKPLVLIVDSQTWELGVDSVRMYLQARLGYCTVQLLGAQKLIAVAVFASGHGVYRTPCSSMLGPHSGPTDLVEKQSIASGCSGLVASQGICFRLGLKRCQG